MDRALIVALVVVPGYALTGRRLVLCNQWANHDESFP